MFRILCDPSFKACRSDWNYSWWFTDILSCAWSVFGSVILNLWRVCTVRPADILLWFLVNDQLDAQFFFMYLFQFCTCFEQPRAHHQENQLYQYNLWYISLCFGDRFVYRSESSFPTSTRNGHRHRVTYTRSCIDTIDTPDDEHGVARNM